MMTKNIRLLLSLIGVFVLIIVPLPEMISGLRPPWMLLFVLYIQFFLPNYFSITLLFLFGLCLDVLLSTVIGVHAFALVLTTWIASGKARRFHFFSIFQQMMLIAPICFIYQFTMYVIDAFLGYSNGIWMIFANVGISTMCWPWFQWLMAKKPTKIQARVY